jgi:hypothetical protein
MRNDRIVSAVYRRLLRESQDTEKEAARQRLIDKLSSMGNDGLGVLVKEGSQFSKISIVIYKTNVFVGNVLAALDTESGQGGDVQSIQDAALRSVVGMVGLDPPKDPCNSAWQVSYIAGKGYSDVLHDIAMQVSPTGAVMPDREAVSDPLVGYYEKMLKRGPGKPTKLDNKKNPSTPAPGDDCEIWADEFPNREVLDNSFSGGGSDYSALKKNHFEAMRTLSSYLKNYLGWTESDVDELLSDVSGLFFTEIYSSVPLEQRGLKRPR